MLRLASPGVEPGNVLYSAEAMSILAAFAEERRARGDDAELDANTLRWLQVHEPAASAGVGDAIARIRQDALREAERTSIPS
jgi:hypothetical protein